MTTFSDLRDAVEGLQKRLDQPKPQPDPFQHIEIERLRREVRRLQDAAPPPVLLGDLVSGRPLLSLGSFTFSSSYSLGGDPFADIPFSSITDVWLQPKPDQVTALHYFEYTGTTIKAYTPTTQVAAGVDLEAQFGAMTYIAFGTGATEFSCFRAREQTVLFNVLIASSNAFAANATNYWTLQLVRRTQDGERFEIGDALSLATRTLTADIASTLYTSEAGLELDEGDTIHVEAVETGTPRAILGLSAWSDARRRVA